MCDEGCGLQMPSKHGLTQRHHCAKRFRACPDRSVFALALTEWIDCGASIAQVIVRLDVTGIGGRSRHVVK